MFSMCIVTTMSFTTPIALPAFATLLIRTTSILQRCPAFSTLRLTTATMTHGAVSMKAKLEHPNKSHPGRAGGKPALLPFHLKKLRASDKDWQEFMSYLTGDAAMDF